MSTTVPGHSTERLSYLERIFHVQERGSTLRTEILAGATTVLTMAYIVFVNPDILSEAGMPIPAVAAATCLSAAIGCILMGLIANYPIALAPGTYEVVPLSPPGRIRVCRARGCGSQETPGDVRDRRPVCGRPRGAMAFRGRPVSSDRRGQPCLFRSRAPAGRVSTTALHRRTARGASRAAQRRRHCRPLRSARDRRQWQSPCLRRRGALTSS